MRCPIFHSTLATFMVVLLGSGCEEGPYCSDFIELVALDDVNPLGYAPDDLPIEYGTARDDLLVTWSDGRTCGGSLAVSWPTAVRYQDGEEGNRNGAGGSHPCSSFYFIDFRIRDKINGPFGDRRSCSSA